MNNSDYLFIGILLLVVTATAIPIGGFMARVYRGESHCLLRPLGWLERLIYRLSGVDSMQAMSWHQYAAALLIFNGLGFVVLFALQLCQQWLPLNPQNLPAVPSWLALNTAVSFVTNTNWQAYSGEVTLSYLTQMLGLTTQNFLSAATGMAVAVCFARSFTVVHSKNLGNFWVDCVRSTIYILLPLSILLALALITQGVVQNLLPYLQLQTIFGADQILPMGPAASQIAIKQLGSNGGGFFGVNSAHPFENPTALTNFLELYAILLLPCAFPFAFGKLTNNYRHGIAVFLAMATIFCASLALGLWSETMPNAILGSAGIAEGKELRFGIGSSVLWGIATTATSNGSVNAMLSSMSPITGGLAMLNIMLGEVVFGGVGSGLYGIALFVIITIFIAGLMVGRSPEYLGKKIEAREIKLSVVGILAPCALILIGSAIAVSTSMGLSSLLHTGPHGLSEVLYAFSSASGNNGSAFGGLSANTTFYNIALSICMLVGRFAVIVPVLMIAGSLAGKKKIPTSAGTFAVDTPLFIGLLVATIVIVGALTFLPALSLGPIVEQLLLNSGKTF